MNSWLRGQIHGGFAHGLGAALLEEFVYDAGGNPQTGTFADYLCITAPEMPELTIGHVNTPSPHNRLGSKGMGDGSSMLAPTVIANAVSDALGRFDIELPLGLNKVWALANNVPYERPGTASVRTGDQREDGIAVDGGLAGEGTVEIAASPFETWRLIFDPDVLASALPGCESLEQTGEDHYRADIVIGVAGMKGRYGARLALHDKQPPDSVRLKGQAWGVLGYGEGEGVVQLEETGEGRTRIHYRYRANVGGKVALVGQRMLERVTGLMIGQFFRGIESHLRNPGGHKSPAWWTRLMRGRKP